ncbi:helix-turn-helix domain-containing protein [Aeromonas veronii]
MGKLTQTMTTEKIGIKQTTVSDFENRIEPTKLEMLLKILAALGLELHVVKR